MPRRLIELHSPDSRNTLILRCKDTATAHSWFTALHANITALLPQVLAELNATLGGGAGGREVKHIAWLAEQVRGRLGHTVPGVGTVRRCPHSPYKAGGCGCPSPRPRLHQARLDGGRQQWRPVLMAVTEKDLLLYDAMPWTRDAWASPCHSYPLVATRWAGNGGATATCLGHGAVPAPLMSPPVCPQAGALGLGPPLALAGL